MPILLSLLLAIIPTAHSAEADIYTYLYAGKVREVPMGYAKKGIRINDLCVSKATDCLALKALNGPQKINEIKNAVDGNFSGAYCELLHGSQIFLIPSADTSPVQFCVFSDASMIDAKGLYRSHYAAMKNGSHEPKP